MKHFSVEAWVDFARGLGDAGVRLRMQRHLSQCPRCTRTLGLLSFVGTVLKGDAHSAGPDAAIRRARRLFVLGKPSPRRAAVPSLVHKSIDQPISSGQRATAGMRRRLVYRAGDIWIDLTVETGIAPFPLHVAGRVTRRLAIAIAAVVVRLNSNRRVVVQTCTNQLGHFRLQSRLTPNARLQVLVADHRRPITIPLRILKPT